MILNPLKLNLYVDFVKLKDKASEAKIQLDSYVDQVFPELNYFLRII